MYGNVALGRAYVRRGALDARPVIIPGLLYQPDYLTPAEQEALLTRIDQQPWQTQLKRRVQHYGYHYDYKKHRVNPSTYLGPLPLWLTPLTERLHREGLFPALPDQAILNEYEPGQGIASHVDCVPCFGDTIVSLSLGSPCVMIFSHTQSQFQVPLLLEPGSLLVMKGESRFLWKHGIPARKTDRYEGRTLVRSRRISITFRTMLDSSLSQV